MEVQQVGESTKSIHADPKVEPTKACKKLFLSSGDNALAEAINRYIRISFDGKIVYGAKKPGPYAVYTSLPTSSDNVPSHYKVEDFCREVFELLVNTPEYCCEKTATSPGQNRKVIPMVSTGFGCWHLT